MYGRVKKVKVVPSKGVENYAAEVVKKMIEQLGYRKVILRSDNEPAIWALKEAVKREREIYIYVGIALEQAPVGDHEANGLVESAIKNVQGEFRVIKDAWESRGIPSGSTVDDDARGVGGQQGEEVR